MSLQRYEDHDTVVAGVHSARREGGHSVVATHYLVAARGKKTRHFQKLARLPLVSAREMLSSFRKAGFRAHVLLEGRYRDRGLYVGVKTAKVQRRM